MSKAIKAVAVVVGVVTGAFFFGAIGAIVGGAIGLMGADLLQSIINPGFDVPDSNDAAAQQNQGILVNKQGTNNHIPVVYGERRVGGNRVFVSTEGENNKYLHVVFVVSEGEIDRFSEIYIDDNLAWTGSSSHATRYQANQGKYRDYMTFETYHGTDNQTAAPLTIGVGGWTNQHRLRGLAYISFRFKWYKIESSEDQDKTPWGGGIPNVTVVMRGKKVANSGTFADSISRSTAYADETVVYDRNPINCLLDYLRNPRYGKGLSNGQIDFKSFRDEAIRWGKLDDGTTIAADDQYHYCNAVVFTDRTIFDNVKTFLFNMRTALPYANGRFACRVEDNRQTDSIYGSTSTPVMTVGEDNLIGTINLESENVNGKYNRVIVTYMGGKNQDELTNEAVEITYPEPDSAEESQYFTEDDDRLNEHRFTLEHVTQDSIARKYAKVALIKSRYRSKIVSFTGDASLHQLQVNDIFTLVYSGLGINGAFRVKSIQFNADYTFNVTAEEHNDLIYGGNVEPYVRRTPAIARPGRYPIYIDQSGNVVHVGNKSDAPLPADWTAPSDLDPAYSSPTSKYTQAELEAALATGNVIGIFDGDIVFADPVYIPKPVITSATVVKSTSGRNLVDVRINFEAHDEPNIEVTQVLIYWPRYNEYYGTPIGNSRTAARDGYVEITGLNPYKESDKFKIQFSGKGGQLVETSVPVSIDFSGFTPGNIIFEEL